MTQPESESSSPRPTLWIGLGIASTVIVLLIALGPALQPRREISAADDALIGPGMFLFSLVAGLSYRKASGLIEAVWASRALRVLAWAAFAWAVISLMATCG